MISLTAHQKVVAVILCRPAKKISSAFNVALCLFVCLFIFGAQEISLLLVFRVSFLSVVFPLYGAGIVVSPLAEPLFLPPLMFRQVLFHLSLSKRDSGFETMGWEDIRGLVWLDQAIVPKIIQMFCDSDLPNAPQCA